MKPLPLLVAVAALSLVGGGAAGSLLSAHRTAAGPADDSAGLSRLAASVEDLRRDQRALRDAFDALSFPLAAPAASAAVSLAQIDSAVARCLDERAAAAAAQAEQDAATTAADAAAEPESALDVEGAVARLLDPALTDLERETLWQQVRDAGLLDDVVAVFEARARANPNDPALQVDLANAYLQKIFEVGSGPLAGVWATRADNTFDAALELDPQNWEARFDKAVSLSFWPPIFGKQSEAIQQFETLIGQQQNQALRPEFADTYLWLGNLYMQSGQAELARQTWSKGLLLFPGNAELESKLPH